MVSPIYPGHEVLYDDPLGSVVELHAPAIVGTKAQRLAYSTSLLGISKLWFETDTNLLYQWNGSAWQGISASGGAVTSVTATSPITSTGGSTPVIGVNLSGFLPSSITVLDNTSAVRTPTGSTNWTSGSATISPTAGTWLISGTIGFGISGAAGYSQGNGVYSTADGADSGTEPPAIATGRAITVKVGVPDPYNNLMNTKSNPLSVGGIMVVMPTIIVAFSSTTQIFLVPEASATTPANCRFTTNINALKISTATS